MLLLSSFHINLHMKVISSNQPAQFKGDKVTEIVFRTNRSCDKFPQPPSTKSNTQNPNKEPNLPTVINFLHSLLHQDKPVPKNYIKKIIQLLTQMQNKNNAFQNHKNISEKTQQLIPYNLKRQLTEDTYDSNIQNQRGNPQRETTRIRKIINKKNLDSTFSQIKQLQPFQLQTSLEKRICELQSKLQDLQKTIEGKQREIKINQAVIWKLEQQKQLQDQNLAQSVRLSKQMESRVRAEKQKDLEELKSKVGVLQIQLFERQAQILSYWSFAIKQKRQ